jgi:ethanolamine utilization microcompartment shell protein EutS
MYRALCLSALVFVSGCAQIDSIPDDQLAHDINIGSQKAAIYGIKYLIKQVPAKKAAVMKDITTADNIIKTNILPIFSGAATADVAKAAIDTALAQLKGSMSQDVYDSLNLVFDILATEIKLPANPADKLSDRTKKAVNAFFSGVAAGFDVLIAQG